MRADILTGFAAERPSVASPEKHSMSETMSSTARAENEIAHGEWLASHDAEMEWGWGSPAGRIRADRRADLIAKGAGLRPGVKALEIGCGTGLFTEKFARTGATIVAVDISPDLIALAKRRGLPQDRVSLLVKRFEDCDVEGPFDAVIGSSVLHHLEFGTALRRIGELLKPGGAVSFAEPNMLNPQVFLERRRWLSRLFPYVSPDETAFVRWKLARQLREHGFCDIDIQPYDWLHPGTPAALMGLVSGAGRVVEATPLAKEFSGSLIIHARKAL